MKIIIMGVSFLSLPFNLTLYFIFKDLMYSFLSLCRQPYLPMSGQANGGTAVPTARPNQKTFLDEVVMTFTSPMAWLLVVALILTWSGVAIVLFDLLDYKTLAGNQALIIECYSRISLFFFCKKFIVSECDVR